MDSKEIERIRNRFRARKSYLMRKKGYSESDAISAASPILEAISDSEERYKSKRMAHESFPGKQTVSYSYRPFIMWQTDERKIEGMLYENILRSCFLLFLIAAFMLLVTTLLIQATITVTGQTGQGLAKAIAIELGILFLAVHKGQSLSETLIAKSTLVGLVLLSLHILHTGVEKDRSRQLRSETLVAQEIKNLKNLRQAALSEHDGYGEEFKTRRKELRAEITGYTAAIDRLRHQAENSLEAQIIEKQASSESLLRVALMLLNMIFAHQLVRRAERLQPELRSWLASKRGWAMT